MITYGHEKFIGQAIEGVLKQEISFPIELIIADDCSPDGTETIVQSYIENHPNGHWVKYTKHAFNKGINENFKWAFELCKGKYIAMCEGDDYWTDSHKLQKQVDFLENNKEFSFCFHEIDKINSQGSLLKRGESPSNLFSEESKFSPNRVLAFGMFINTCSLVFRNSDNIFRNYGNSPNLPFGDKTLEKILALEGWAYCFRESMANYRINEESITQTKNWKEYGIKKTCQDHIDLYCYLKSLTTINEQRIIIDRVIRRYSDKYKYFNLLWFFAPNSICLIYIYSDKNIVKFLRYYYRELEEGFKRFVVKYIFRKI